LSLLSDYDINKALFDGKLVVDPYPAPSAVGSASLDLYLGTEFAEYPPGVGVIDPESPPPMYKERLVAKDGFLLKPQAFALGHTRETVTLTPGLAGFVDGRSSHARIGLLVHCTAGYIDPGFTGQLTLEFFNAAPRPILLRPGVKICQLLLHRVSSTARRPYGHPDLGSLYQNSVGVVSSRYGQMKGA